MKIVFFGYDYTLDILQRLIADKHEIAQIFTFPCDNVFSSHIEIQQFANYHEIPITDEAITPSHIDALIQQDCTLFLSAGYPHKIPPLPDDVYGINMHPALLPRVRGIMPLPYVIMKEPEAAGFTLHKLAQDFDCGDIIYQDFISIDAHTDVETLSAKIAVRAPDAVSKVVTDIKIFWENASPQNEEEASTYPIPDADMRQIKWGDTSTITATKGRAFGRFGVIAKVENDFGQSQSLAVFNLSTWEEPHEHKQGQLIRSSNREIVIAIQDGYVCLKEFQVL